MIKQYLGYISPSSGLGVVIGVVGGSLQIKREKLECDCGGEMYLGLLLSGCSD